MISETDLFIVICSCTLIYFLIVGGRPAWATVQAPHLFPAQNCHTVGAVAVPHLIAHQPHHPVPQGWWPVHPGSHVSIRSRTASLALHASIVERCKVYLIPMLPALGSATVIWTLWQVTSLAGTLTFKVQHVLFWNKMLHPRPEHNTLMMYHLIHSFLDLILAWLPVTLSFLL